MDGSDSVRPATPSIQRIGQVRSNPQKDTNSTTLGVQQRGVGDHWAQPNAQQAADDDPKFSQDGVPHRSGKIALWGWGARNAGDRGLGGSATKVVTCEGFEDRVGMVGGMERAERVKRHTHRLGNRGGSLGATTSHSGIPGGVLHFQSGLTHLREGLWVWWGLVGPSEPAKQSGGLTDLLLGASASPCGQVGIHMGSFRAAIAQYDARHNFHAFNHAHTHTNTHTSLR